MAKDEHFYFHDVAKGLLLGEHNFQSDDIRYFLASNATPPTEDDVEPAYGDYDEVTTSYNVAGGLPVPNRTVTQTDGTGVFDHDSLYCLSESGAPNFSYIIIYNASHPLLACVMFIHVVDDPETSEHDLSTTPYRWIPNSEGSLVLAKPA